MVDELTPPDGTKPDPWPFTAEPPDTLRELRERD